jgi:hypothetical protein
MQLARAAAARAQIQLTEPEAESAPQAQPLPIPAPEPQSAPAPTAAEPRITAPHLRAPTCNAVDPALLFVRLAAAVRDCIALEARLAAGPAAAATTPAALRADPRRAPLRKVFETVTERLPDRATLRREAATRADAHLAADPDQTQDHHLLFFIIWAEMGLETDWAQIPDAYVEAASAAVAADPTFHPWTHATDPP